MPPPRRSFLHTLLAFVFAGLPISGRTGVLVPKTETANKLADAIAVETGGQQPAESQFIRLEAPDIAEDGSIVPITIASELPNVYGIWVFVEKNPTPLAARFDIGVSLDPFVSLRIKMSESCEVIAMVKSGEEYFIARKPVRVVLGGCG